MIHATTEAPKHLLILVGSPRRTGNSATLAQAVQRGAETAGTRTSVRFVDDYITRFLGDCRTCRNPDGTCGIDDRYRALFRDEFLPADGVVFCSPIYWYGLSAQMKAFFDRSFCVTAPADPQSADAMHRMASKRLGLVLASEETYPGAALGIIHQMQEYARYTHSELIGVVRGVGNSRGEVVHDPADPLQQAETLGRTLFHRKHSEYRMDTPRSGHVWAHPGDVEGVSA